MIFAILIRIVYVMGVYESGFLLCLGTKRYILAEADMGLLKYQQNFNRTWQTQRKVETVK